MHLWNRKELSDLCVEGPSLSADLKPTDHLWWILERRVYSHPRAPHLDALSDIERDDWLGIEASSCKALVDPTCKALVDPTPPRMAAVIKAKGVMPSDGVWSSDAFMRPPRATK